MADNINPAGEDNGEPKTHPGSVEVLQIPTPQNEDGAPRHLKSHSKGRQNNIPSTKLPKDDQNAHLIILRIQMACGAAKKIDNDEHSWIIETGSWSWVYK